MSEPPQPSESQASIYDYAIKPSNMPDNGIVIGGRPRGVKGSVEETQHKNEGRMRAAYALYLTKELQERTTDVPGLEAEVMEMFLGEKTIDGFVASDCFPSDITFYRCNTLPARTTPGEAPRNEQPAGMTEMAVAGWGVPMQGQPKRKKRGMECLIEDPLRDPAKQEILDGLTHAAKKTGRHKWDNERALNFLKKDRLPEENLFYPLKARIDEDNKCIIRIHNAYNLPACRMDHIVHLRERLPFLVFVFQGVFSPGSMSALQEHYKTRLF